MADDNAKYQHKSVQAIRGTEAHSIAKWETQGWELVDQAPGKLRTTLIFRKPAPRMPWRPIAALLGVGVLILAIVGISNLFRDADSSGSKPPASSTPNPSHTPSDSAAEVRAEQPEATPAEPKADETIKAENNDDFAAILVGGECDNAVKTFATENAGKTVEFDGGIADMQPHGTNQTRYDILITPGDEGPNAAIGPYFKFEDVNTGDLNLVGKVPNRFGTGDLVHVIANVERYSPQTCLFFLEPVSTGFRK